MNNEGYVLLIIEQYYAYVRFNALSHIEENHIIIIGMPSHMSHVLQKLEVSVFSSSKGYISKEFNYWNAQSVKLKPLMPPLPQKYHIRNSTILEMFEVGFINRMPRSLKSEYHMYLLRKKVHSGIAVKMAVECR